MNYAELHCHSNYSFQEGASFIHELVPRAVELGYPALALTDHDNLCGAMEFARTARSLGIQPIIGAEVTLNGGYHITLLAETREGYSNLCRLLSAARLTTDRREPELDPRFLPEHSAGLILLSGCCKGEIPSLVEQGRLEAAGEVAGQYREWFGRDNLYLELQQNLVQGDTQRNRNLIKLAGQLDVGVVATNNVHYHVRERHQLHDCLVSTKHLKSLEESHRERRANSEFYLKSPCEMADLFRDCPEAIANTLCIADRCAAFDLTRDLDYRFPDYPVPDGFTPDSYFRHLCDQAAVRRYGSITDAVKARLDEEFRLIRRHNLAGFLLIYHDIIQLGREVMIDLGLTDPEIPVEENPPGRGRGSSVCMLVGYLIGLSHIDPLQFNLSLERFISDDGMASVPDIDLDFPRNIREELIKRVHQKYGWERAALTGMISTYKLKGAVRDLGKALGLPPDQVDKLAKRADHGHAANLGKETVSLPEFRDRVAALGWRDLVRLAAELDGFPKCLAQHPGGMVIGSTPLTDLVPVQPGAIADRYVMQWDKDSIDDAGFAKIDFLALGALSQMQEALDLIEKRTGHRPDISRIDFEDQAVYDMLCHADTIGIFQVESAAQMQTITRIRPQNLTDMAHEVAAVRPGVGVNDGVSKYIRRKQGLEPMVYDHPLEIRALEKTRGVILFQDQVNQVAIDVAGFSPLEADQLRRAYGRRNKAQLIQAYWEKFREGAGRKGVDEETAHRIFKKFNGEYMFPESHAFAFGVTAYQASWLKYYYPLEFYTGLFNQQPMGFYNMETLKEDAKRHGIRVLNPDINRSREKSVIEREALRLGFLNVAALGPAAAETIVGKRDEGGSFASIADFMERTGLSQEALDNLADAGAVDSVAQDRRNVRWEIGLRYRPVNKQLALPLPVVQDTVPLPRLTSWETMEGEYRTMGLHPGGHIMAYLREQVGAKVTTSQEVEGLEDGVEVTVTGLIIRRQRPLGKAVFITLEDEFGHIPLIIWPGVYQQYRHVLSGPLILAKGMVSHREGTMNIVLSDAREIPSLVLAPNAKSIYPPPPLDHFKCYQTTGDLPQSVFVLLRDQFDTGDRPIKPIQQIQARQFCNPVQKTHNGVKTIIQNVNTHLELYSIQTADEPVPPYAVVNNQFGEQVLNIRKPFGLAVPTLIVPETGVPGVYGLPRVQIDYQNYPFPSSGDVDRVISKTDGETNTTGVPAGGTIFYAYFEIDPGGPPGTNDPTSMTTVTDRNGNITEYKFNKKGNIVQAEEFTNRNVRSGDSPSFVTSQEFNEDGKVTRVIRPEGNSVELAYDESNPDRLQQGNLLQITRVPDAGRGGDQGDLITTYTYEPIYNRLRTVTQPRGNDPTYVPQNGGPNSPDRYTTRYTYDYEEGCDIDLIAAATMRSGSEVQQLFTDAGVCGSPLGDVNQDNTTDQIAGNLIRIQRPTVQLLSDSNQAVVEGGILQPIVNKFAYNDKGQLIRTIDPEGTVNKYLYHPGNDPDGDRMDLTPGVGNGPFGYLKEAVEDAFFDSIDVSRDGVIDILDLAKAASRIGGPDPTGEADANGDGVVGIEELLLIAKNFNATRMVVSSRTQYSYDRVGNLTRRVDGRGVATDYVVNQLNQVVQVVQQRGDCLRRQRQRHRDSRDRRLPGTGSSHGGVHYLLLPRQPEPPPAAGG